MDVTDKTFGIIQFPTLINDDEEDVIMRMKGTDPLPVSLGFFKCWISPFNSSISFSSS